jgi:hypothetical protein
MKIEPTLSITIEDVTYTVSELSPQQQTMVAYMDDWRQREADNTSLQLMARVSIQYMQQQLLQTLSTVETSSETVEENDARG